MAFDFPNSPSEGQIFNAPSGPTYVFNSPRWRAMAQGQIAIISDTAPANPANGTLWFESDTGILFISMNDGNSTQWVQCGGIAQAAPSFIQCRAFATTTSPITLHDDTKSFFVQVQAGGGGSGNCPNGSSALTAAAVGGGGAGGYGEKWYTRQPGMNPACTVGAGGTSTLGGGGSQFVDGLGNNVTTGGGLASGSAPSAGTHVFLRGGAASGATTGADLSRPGGAGFDSFVTLNNAANSIAVASGRGADSVLGNGGQGSGATTGSAGQGTGTAAGGYGAGGGGAYSMNGGTAIGGGTGSSGVVIVTEYR